MLFRSFAISKHLHRSEDYWTQEVLAYAKRLHSPCLLSQDAFFHAPEEKTLSDLLHAIRTNQTLDQCGRHFFPNSERHLHSLAAIEAHFSSFPLYATALKASQDLAASIDFCFSELKYHYPQEMIPPGYQAQSYLEHLTWSHAQKQFSGDIPAQVREQLLKELTLIEKLAFADYFLTVWDIVHWARQQGILCQGRGSAANSSVCFILGITAVNPTLFDMLFERFISMERGDPPDIDVDFEHERREEVIQYIYRRYGRQRAAMVANVISFRGKGALRATGKAFGVAEPILKHVSRLQSSKHFRGSHFTETLQTAQSQLEKQDLWNLESIPWELWATMAERIRGFPRHLGLHSGGFILSQESINCLVAQEPATKEGRTVVQWCKEDIEGLGFFKIDILSLGMLTALKKCMDYIKTHYHHSYTMANVPPNDFNTYAMIQRADTVGTFQIESRAQMSMLPRLRPKKFYDLVIEVAIIRPGPIQGKVIHPYLSRRSGHESISFPDVKLRPILARTLGVIIFQEQLMRIATELGDFTPGEANELRKMTGVWNANGFVRKLEPFLAKLISGMRKNHLSESFIQQMLGQMRGFADYGFPESHAVSFALIAYVSSYFKCWYPAAFFTAILNSQPMGFYSPHALIQAAKRSHVSILPICINHSQWDSQIEQHQLPAKKPTLAIRLGFRLVNGLRKKGVEELVSTRQKLSGAFTSFSQFTKYCKLHRSDLISLAAANAFALFGHSRKEAIWLSEAAPFCSYLEEYEAPLSWPQETTVEKTERDFEAFGTSLGLHPSLIMRQEFWNYEAKVKNLRSASDLLSFPKGKKVEVFGMILAKQAPPSAKGMVFLTLEDHTGFLNLVLSPQKYALFYKLVDHQAFLCVQGILQKAQDYASILVEYVFPQKISNAQIMPLQPQENSQEIVEKKQVSPMKPLIKPRSYF